MKNIRTLTANSLFFILGCFLWQATVFAAKAGEGVLQRETLGNLIVNSSFEVAISEENPLPYRWYNNNVPGIAVSLDYSAQKFGNYSIKLTRRGHDFHVYQTIREIDGNGPAGDLRGEELVFSCWMKSEGESFGQLKFSDGTQSEYSDLSRSRDWTLLSTTIKVADSAEHLNIELNVTGPDGSVYFDGAMLTKDAITGEWRLRQDDALDLAGRAKWLADDARRTAIEAKQMVAQIEADLALIKKYGISKAGKPFFAKPKPGLIDRIRINFKKWLGWYKNMFSKMTQRHTE